MFPDIEKLVHAYLSGQITERVCTELDPDFAVPVVQIYRIAGEDRDYALDHPMVDVDAYAASRGQAMDLARQVQSLLRFSIVNQVTTFGVVTHSRTVVGPRILPYEDTTKRRASATYALAAHQ